MSGIELALAVAPLIIAGSHSYRALYESARTIAHQSVKVEKHVEFLTDLHFEVSMLNITLRGLTESLPGISAEEKQALLGLEVSRWKAAAVQHALKERLKGSQKAFELSLASLLKALNNLISEKSLGLETVSNAQEQSYHKLTALVDEPSVLTRRKDRIVDRFRFTSNEKSRTHALRRIIDHNSQLQRLINQALGPVPVPTKQRSVGMGPPRALSRQLTTALYGAMARSWACNCAKPHEARLCLLGCFVKGEAPTVASLDMLISARPDDGINHTWQESNVRIVAEQQDDAPVTTVRFEINGRTVQSMDAESATTLVGRRNEVRSLCSLVSDQAARPVSVGIEFHAGLLYRAQSRRKSLSAKQPLTGSRLGELLGAPTAPMSLKQKRVLAVIVAHAVLHFCEGPWLQKSWDKHHISFFAQPDGAVDLTKPYLSTIFQGDLDPGSEEADLLNVHHCPPILALGILLLELHRAKPIESYYNEEDLQNGIPNSNTNLTTAERLLHELKEDVFDAYWRAIEACLSCDFGTAYDMPTLDNDAFRMQVYEKIVAPLEDELWVGYKLSPAQLQLKEQAPSVQARA